MERVALLLLCLLFIVLGWPFLKRLGIEVDEALVASGIYKRAVAWYSMRLFRHQLPLMELSYLGALKTWIVAPIFAVWGPGPVSLRLPSALAGAGTVAAFWYLLRSLLGRRAAWIGAVLLATDTSFLLLTTIDFGPVALHLLLKTTALALLVIWHRTDRESLFAAAWFLFGLAFWDKAVFIWIAAGMALGALAAFPRLVARTIRPRLAAIGVAAFVLGCLPLVIYNVARPLDTFRSNARLAPKEILPKIDNLRETVNGRVLFGFFTALDTPPQPGSLEAPFRSALLSLSRATGRTDHNWTVWILAACVAAIPFVWRTPARAPAVFGVVSFSAGWLAMAVSSGAGGSAHHVVLLWPMHFLVIAAVLAAVPGRLGRWPVIALVALLSCVNVLVTNQYYLDLVRNGPAIRWTDASPALVRYLEGARAEIVFVVDWDILETVNLLTKGSVPVIFAEDYTSKPPDPATISSMREIMTRPDTIFVSHTQRFELLPGVNSALQYYASKAGVTRTSLATIQDRHGRDVFDVFQFR